ncbi:lipid II:glycine glycyltransferase FemX [Gabonibacter chumensis]|uniref:lipid II:glycine glycyltransferase FemX n=1 Tax=Gabonibacter chumensis TaxID=2972474 RepID=UPI0025730893|nr:peptidoglycan bridge formation glycyltransferase FemA/FemB family protein [Gabonibacter chumensis]MCR9012820.1 peptidoglycan bridge formation glycyltransferase FemA/FemB family protein [Gabonibacter chumensis]
MKIIKEIDNYKNILPVLAYPEYLASTNSMIDYGYFIQDRCIQPFIVRKKLFFKYIQLPSAVIGGTTHEERQNFLNDVITYVKKNFHTDMMITVNTVVSDVFPTGSLYCKFASYILDLSKTEDELFKGLHSKHRNVIRKAEKDGLIIDYGNQYSQTCFEIIQQTFSRQGKMTSNANFATNLKILGENVDYWIVKDNERICGCAILLWSKGFTSYYLYGGSRERPHSGALNLLHWTAILKMKERGVKYYDFVGARINPDVGSKLEGIQRFKSRFGGDFKIGYMWRYVFHPLKYFMYQTLLWGYLRLLKRDDTPIDAIKEERKKGNF